MPESAPAISGILETCIYAGDLPAMEQFYANVLGLRKVSDNSPRGLTFRVSRENVLLIFNPDKSREAHDIVPSHGCKGAGHVAFAVEPTQLDEWRTHLMACGVVIEREATWEHGAHSIYFRDPAGNSVELVAGDLWPR